MPRILAGELCREKIRMSSRPKILLVGLELHWPAPSRLPRALQAAGFAVGVACHARAFLAHTKFRDHFFRLPDKNHGDGILAGLKTIFSAWPPDLLLPMDDWTALFLTRVHERLSAAGDASRLVDLLRRSLGNPVSTSEALSKRRTVEIARGLGVRVPASRTVDSAPEILEFGRAHGFPVVLKLSYASSGKGVAVCRDEKEISATLASLRQEKKTTSRVKFFRERLRGRMMETGWLPGDSSLTVNQFIPGKCATSLTVALEGKMLAALTAEVEHTYLDAHGPASVIRLVRNEEMRSASATMLKHWGLTGMIGFDFMLDAMGQAWLIECNPRPTPLAHLGAHVGEDLCVALHQGLISAPPPPATEPPKELLIAHFPQESWRDPNSQYFTSAYHDVPVDDPGLLACLKNHPAPTRGQS
jgi:biotin carboxylase